MPSFTFFVGNHRYVNHLKDTGPFDLKANEKNVNKKEKKEHFAKKIRKFVDSEFVK